MPKVKGTRRAKLKKRFDKLKRIEKNNLPKGKHYVVKQGDKEIQLTRSLKVFRKADRKATAKHNQAKGKLSVGGSKDE